MEESRMNRKITKKIFRGRNIITFNISFANNVFSYSSLIGIGNILAAIIFTEWSGYIESRGGIRFINKYGRI